jgi:uncharacterized protein (TIGR03437 family)
LFSNGFLFAEAFQINRVSLPNGALDVLIGEGGTISFRDFFRPYGLTVDMIRNDIYFTSPDRSAVFKVSAAGAVSRPISDPTLLDTPRGVAVDAEGNLFVAVAGAHKILRVTPTGVVTTVAGTGTAGFSGDGGPATSAQFSSPSGMAIDILGNIYVADTGNHRIRVLSPVQSPPAISTGGIVDAGSFQANPVSPGKIIAIFGTNLGPPVAVGAQVANGALTQTLGNVRVLFDGIPAPLTAASSGQVNAIVPYAVSGRATTSVVVEYQGQRSPAVTVPVQAASPSLFTANASGTGQGAILNQDGSLNGVESPSTRGSIVVLFGTGEGLTTPAGVDGKLAVPPYPAPILPLTVQIGGIDAEVLYAGAAPGLTAGLFQVNVRVPAGLARIPGVGQYPVVVRVGSFTSQAGVTVAVSN